MWKTWFVTLGQTPETSTGIQIERGKTTKASFLLRKEMAVVWRSLNPIKQRNLIGSLQVHSLKAGLMRSLYLVYLVGQPREWMALLFKLKGLLNIRKV